MTKFKYLGSALSQDGELDEEVERRIQEGWRNWKRLLGFLCDMRLSARRKGKVFKVAIRPAMTNGTETWSIKKTQEKKMDVASFDPPKRVLLHPVKCAAYFDATDVKNIHPQNNFLIFFRYFSQLENYLFVIPCSLSCKIIS